MRPHWAWIIIMTDSPLTEILLNDRGRQAISRDSFISEKISLVNAIFPIRENHRISGETHEQITRNRTLSSHFILPFFNSLVL